MEKLLAVLKEVKPGVDFENATNLLSGKLIDSIDMTTILAQLEDTFDIEIDMEYITPEYFDSARAMWDMIQELMD